MKKQLLYNSLVILNCTDSPYSENSPYLIFSNSKADPQHLKPKGATEPAWERCFLSITVVLAFCRLLLLSLIRILLWGGSGCFLHITPVQLEKQDTEIEILNLWGSPTFFFLPFQRWSNLFIVHENQSKVCWHLPSELITITFGLFFSFHVLSRCCWLQWLETMNAQHLWEKKPVQIKQIGFNNST